MEPQELDGRPLQPGLRVDQKRGQPPPFREPGAWFALERPDDGREIRPRVVGDLAIGVSERDEVDREALDQTTSAEEVGSGESGMSVVTAAVLVPKILLGNGQSMRTQRTSNHAGHARRGIGEVPDQERGRGCTFEPGDRGDRCPAHRGTR